MLQAAEPGDVARAGYDTDLFQAVADIEERSFWFRARNRLIVAMFQRRFADAESFLEVGCGTGGVLAALRISFPQLRLLGVERYREGLEMARRRLPNETLVELDARELPYENEFDVVGAFDVLEHVDEDEQVLSNMVRAARPGGGVFVLVPQHPWLWSAYDEAGEHRRRYTRRDLVGKAQRAGIDVLQVSSFVSTLLPAMVLSRVVGRVRGRSNGVAMLDPGPLNGIFERMLDGERRLIERGVSLPFGGTLMLVGVKPPIA